MSQRKPTSSFCPDRHIETTITVPDTDEEDSPIQFIENEIIFIEDDSWNSHNSRNRNIQELNGGNRTAGESMPVIVIDSSDSDDDIQIICKDTKRRKRDIIPDPEFEMRRNQAERRAIDGIERFRRLLNAGNVNSVLAPYDEGHPFYEEIMKEISPVFEYHPELKENFNADRLRRLGESARLNCIQQFSPPATATEADTTENCAICQLSFKETQHLRVLTCTHIFHKRCIDRWSMENRTCPNCRAHFGGPESGRPIVLKSDTMRSLEFILEYLLNQQKKRKSQATNSDCVAGTSSNL